MSGSLLFFLISKTDSTGNCELLISKKRTRKLFHIYAENCSILVSSI